MRAVCTGAAVAQPALAPSPSDASGISLCTSSLPAALKAYSHHLPLDIYGALAKPTGGSTRLCRSDRAHRTPASLRHLSSDCFCPRWSCFVGHPSLLSADYRLSQPMAVVEMARPESFVRWLRHRKSARSARLARPGCGDQTPSPAETDRGIAVGASDSSCSVGTPGRCTHRR
jgi:hypothetical protein